MLSARINARTIHDHLTSSLNVVDALEESEIADWDEIVLLGFTYDKSDLLKFENICHSPGGQIKHHGKLYTLRSIEDQARITFLATHDGDCRLTQTEFDITYSVSSALRISRRLRVTLFVFSNTLDRQELRESEDRMSEFLYELYVRHKQRPIPIYFIGHARPPYFNIPLIFEKMDETYDPAPSSQAIIVQNTQRINQRLAESKDSQELESKAEIHFPPQASKKETHKKRYAGIFGLRREAHRLARNSLSSREKEIDEQGSDNKRSSCLMQ